MKVLLVSDRKEERSKTDFLVNAYLRKFDADVIYAKYNSERVTLFDKILNKLNIELDKSDVNNRIFNKLSGKKYSVLIILKGNRIAPWTLSKVKKLYPDLKIASWSGDNMTKWHNKSFFYHFGVNFYDIVFSVNIPDYKNIELICNKPVFYFNKRADRYTHFSTNRERKEFKYNVLFIGSYEAERLGALSFLASNGINVDIFGAMWGKCKEELHQNLTVHNKELIGQAYTEAISNSKITLGFLRKINKDTQTSRTFEIPACGGFMLMERTIEHADLFKEGCEAEFFGSNAELLKKTKYYLANDLKREVIAVNGLARVKLSSYYFDDLAQEMMDKTN